MKVATAVRSYAELGRASNLPTCVSNVLVGAAVGAGGGGLPWLSVLTAMIAVSLLYVGGMAMNGAVDTGADRMEFPSRPIPSGRVGTRAAWVFTGVACGLGVGVLGVAGKFAAGAGLVLVAMIVGYNLLHKLTAWSALLMGACRGLVYLVALAAVLPTALPEAEMSQRIATGLWLAGALGVYITAVTLVARMRRSVDSQAWNPIGVLLAGVCLIDASFLTLLDRPGLALTAGLCFAATTLAHRFVSGT